MSATDMHNNIIELKAVILCGTFCIRPWDNTIITCYTWHLSGYILQRVELTWWLEKCADYSIECQPVQGFGSEVLASHQYLQFQ